MDLGGKDEDNLQIPNRLFCGCHICSCVFSLEGGYLAGGLRTFATLLFFVGAFIAGIGAFTFVGQSRPGFAEWYAHSAGSRSGRQVEIFLEDREKQRRQGIIIIVFGVALIGLSLAVGWPLEFIF